MDEPLNELQELLLEHLPFEDWKEDSCCESFYLQLFSGLKKSVRCLVVVPVDLGWQKEELV